MIVVDVRDKNNIVRMVEYCTRIEEACQRFGSSLQAFEEDADFRDVVCMNIFQIGELANQISDELKNTMGDIPWDQM